MVTTPPIVAGSPVILTGQWLKIAADAVATHERMRRQKGVPDTGTRALAAAIDKARTNGHMSDMPKPAVPHTEKDRLLSTKEAAELMNRCERTARRRARQLGGRKVNGQWRIRRSAVLEHLGGVA